MNSIIYPPTINTDFERLCAVYPLIEQMRLEHNKVATLAKGDWGKYAGKFRTYAKESKARLKKLLAERNRLIESIRTDNRAIWEGVTDEEALTSIHLDLFGDRETLKNKETEATSPLLDELKVLNLDDIPETLGADPTEDFTTYTEVDPNSHISKTADRITFTQLPRNDVSYVYYDKGAGHFDGNFEQLRKFYISEHTGLTIGTWALANYVGACDSSQNFILIWAYKSAESSQYVNYMREYHNSSAYSDYSVNFNNGTVYYAEVERDEGVGDYGTLYEYICTGNYYSDGGSLVDTISVALHVKDDYRYIYGLQSRNEAGITKYGTGYIELLDLQEGGVTEKTGNDFGSGADTKASGNPINTLTKSETGSAAESLFGRDIAIPDTGSGADALSALSAVLTRDDSGSGVEQSLMAYWLSSSDSGSGVEVAALIAVLMLGDVGTGADVSILPWLKAVFGGDEGSGLDALKALIETAGSSSGMRLHGRTGQVRTPSKGVNL